MSKTRFMKWTAAFVALLCLVPLEGYGQAGDTALYLPLPAVPSTLRTPAARADYVLRYFWDSMDFASARSRDRDFMERNFANYLSLFPVADTAALRPTVEALVVRAQADAEALSLLWEVAGKYLYETESPMYNESYYELFTDTLWELPSMSGYGRMRLQAERETMWKNHAGTPAADFAYETRAGTHARLSETGEGKPLLLLFYDPDCGHCTEVMKELAAPGIFSEMVGRGELAVLAVYAGEDDRSRERWRQTADRLPAAWTAGYNNGTIYQKDLYVLRDMPTLYLLDTERKVIARNLTVERLAALLSSLAPPSLPTMRGGTPCSTARNAAP